MDLRAQGHAPGEPSVTGISIIRAVSPAPRIVVTTTSVPPGCVRRNSVKSVIPRIGVLFMFTMMSSTLKSAAAGESGSTYRTPNPR